MVDSDSRLSRLLPTDRLGIPRRILVELLLRLYGRAGFEVLRAAADATVQRVQAARNDEYVVSERPEGRWFGDYRTARRGEALRPYVTRLYRLDRLEASCGCPDFRGNSLGACKHVFAVLMDLERRSSTHLDPVHDSMDEPGAAELRWSACKPLTGPGDWMLQIELHRSPTQVVPERGWRRLVAEFSVPKDRSIWRLPDAHGTDIARRRSLLRRLERRCTDPALRAWIEEEYGRLRPALRLEPLREDGGTPPSFRRDLYPFQREGLRRFLESGRLLLADDMGLGKTTQAIAACHALFHAGVIRRGVLVVPAPLKRQWLREWADCSDVPVAVVEGDPAERAQHYRRRASGFRIVNYEQVLRDVDRIQGWKPEIVVLDEAQRIKNWQTKTAQTIKRLTPPFRLALTGTPFENRLTELDSILDWIDPRPLQPAWRIEPYHQIGDGEGMRHLGVLRERLGPVVLRRQRNDVLSQLPRRTDTRIDVPLTPEQREAHDQRDAPIAQILRRRAGRPLTRPEFLKLMALFTQQRILCNGVGQSEFDSSWPRIASTPYTDQRLRELAMPKLAKLRALLGECVIEQRRKVVVFSAWRRALRLAEWSVRDLLAESGSKSAFFTGAESLTKRDRSLVAFHDDPATMVLFATDAGGVGLNLQRAASCCVHFDLPWNPAVFEQRVGRIWRLGQEKDVSVYSLVGEDCIESRIASVLRMKQQAFFAVFVDDSDEVRFEAEGDFLLAAQQLVDDSSALQPAEAESDPAPAPFDGVQIQIKRDGGLAIDIDRASADVLAGALQALARAISHR